MLTLFYDTDIFKEVTRMVEFYDKLGILSLFENGDILSTNQIYMNPEAREALFEGLMSNMNQNEVYKRMEQEEATSMVSYDFVQFAPQINELVVFDQIVIVPLEQVYTPTEENLKKN